MSLTGDLMSEASNFHSAACEAGLSQMQAREAFTAADRCPVCDMNAGAVGFKTPSPECGAVVFPERNQALNAQAWRWHGRCYSDAATTSEG
jgi:hypothetical protein